MVRGVNKVILLGNTAAEPDFRVLANGSTSIATVALATNESYRDQNGNLQEQTEWHRLVFWGRTAEIARDYMRKGSQIYVEGKIKTRSYDDQQGIKRYTTEIHVTELHLLSQKPAGNGAPYPAPGYPQQASRIRITTSRRAAISRLLPISSSRHTVPRLLITAAISSPRREITATIPTISSAAVLMPR